MPLYKRKPFSLCEPPKDLKAEELVFQVRFTNEIFREYGEYLKRLNLYRLRIWTCKVTWKGNLTYEEALMSEHSALEKVHKFPADLVAPTLHKIQFSTSNLTNLVSEIREYLPKQLFQGLYLQGKKNDTVCSCKILEVLDGKITQYKVGWIDQNKKVTDTSIVKAEDLISKPLGREVLKAFIRESTCHSAPWLVHESLAKKHSISTELPLELINKLTFENGCVRYTIKIKGEDTDFNNKRKEIDGGDTTYICQINKKIRIEKENEEDQPVKYPIDDILVRPAPNDPVFTERPPPSSDFNLPIGSVGDLIMVWDFCCSFRKLLCLWPFNLDDLENAVNHRDNDLNLIVEMHSALLHLLIKDGGDYFRAIQNKRRNPKITLINWTEYLCDFLMMKDKVNLSNHISTIKRGHYGCLDSEIKLHILHQLVEEAILTAAVRESLENCIDQRQALAATKREEARKNKEAQLKTEDSDETVNGLQSSIMKMCSSVADESDHKHRASTTTDTANKMKKNDGAGTAIISQKDRVKESCDEKPGEDRLEQIESEIEKLTIRSSPLGKDRNYNRYWFFRREGRLFVESSDSKQWGYYTNKDELDALIGSLNPKGERERFLKKQLEKNYNKISLALQKRSNEFTPKIMLEENVHRRSTRVRAQPREDAAFLQYVNKWKSN